MSFFERRIYIKNYLSNIIPNVIASLISEYDYHLGCVSYNLSTVDKSLYIDCKIGLDDCSKYQIVMGQCYKNVVRILDLRSLTTLDFILGELISVQCFTNLFFGQIAVCCNDDTIKILNMKTMKCDSTFIGHYKMLCITTLPNGSNKIVGGSYDSTIKVWNIQTGNCDLTLSDRFSGPIWCVAGFTDCSGDKIVVGSQDRLLRIWNVKTNECEFSLKGHNRSIRSVAILPNGNIVSGSYDKTLKIWQFKNGTYQCKLTLVGHNDYITSIAILPDGRIVSASFDRTLKIWDPITGNCDNTLIGHDNKINNVIVTHHGQIISSSEDKTIKIWS